MTVVERSVGDRVELPGSRSPTDPERNLRPGRRQLSREQVAANQRSRIVDAFVLVAAEDGYEQAGVRNTCKRAGVAFNTFYEYFDSIEEVFVAAWDAGVGALFHEAFVAYSASGGPWSKKVEAAITRFLRITAENPAFARFCAVESRKVGSAARDRVDTSFSEGFALFAGTDPAPGLTMGITTLSQMAVGGLFTPVYFSIRAGRVQELVDLAPSVTQFVLTLFREGGSDQGQPGSKGSLARERYRAVAPSEG